MTKKLIRQKPRCANCMVHKSRFLNKCLKVIGIILFLNISYTNHCLKCKKNTENVNSKALKTTNGTAMLLSKCAVCGRKKSRLMKEQEAKGILRSLGLKALLSKIPLFGDILF